MSAIPLHIQRRFEQRWAARPVPPITLPSLKSLVLKPAAPTSQRIRKPRKTRRVEAAGH